MTRHSFIQMSKLSNVKGRISYITSPARQENLYATYHTADAAFPHRRASGGSPRQGEIHRVQTEGLCDGYISRSNGEAFVVAFAPLTPF